MKVWNHTPNDTRRVRLLKNITNHLHGEIASIASTAIVDGVTEIKHGMMIQDFTKLNERLKIARKREALQFAMSLQTEFNFKPKKKRKKRKAVKKKKATKKKRK